MSRATVARLLRLLLVACWAGAVFAVVALAFEPLVSPSQQVLLPFVAAAVAAEGLVLARDPIDRLVRRLTHHRFLTRYSVLAQTTARVGAGSLEQALPGLAQVLAEGTDAQRAALWLAVEGELVEAAAYPPREGERAGAENLAVLLARPDTDHVVPVLDGVELRAALTIGKPGAAITPADQRLMHDVAEGAGLLLRSVQRGAELREQVRRADELAAELRESRERLTRAREVERRRLVGELSTATTGRMAGLREELAAAGAELDAQDAAAAHGALGRARVQLDELLERFRAIARGVYPTVLRDRGPAAALDEVATDLPRSVRLTAEIGERLGWEVESGVYYLAAAAVSHLAGRSAGTDLFVHLEHADGRLAVRVEDPALDTGGADALREALAVDVERIAALGGAVEIAASATGTTVVGWLPDRLEPMVEARVPAGRA